MEVSSPVGSELPITGDIPGADITWEESLTLGKTKDWLKPLPARQFSIFKLKVEEEYPNSKALQRFLQKSDSGEGESVFVSEIC